MYDKIETIESSRCDSATSLQVLWSEIILKKRPQRSFAQFLIGCLGRNAIWTVYPERTSSGFPGERTRELERREKDRRVEDAIATRRRKWRDEGNKKSAGTEGRLLEGSLELGLEIETWSSFRRISLRREGTASGAKTIQTAIIAKRPRSALMDLEWLHKHTRFLCTSATWLACQATATHRIFERVESTFGMSWNVMNVRQCQWRDCDSDSRGMWSPGCGLFKNFGTSRGWHRFIYLAA